MRRGSVLFLSVGSSQSPTQLSKPPSKNGGACVWSRLGSCDEKASLLHESGGELGRLEDISIELEECEFRSAR